MDRHETPPFMLQLFYRTGAFHRPDEFTTTPLPPHLTLHTWPNCTLTELSHHLAASSSSILPNPAIGTRLAFRLIFPDPRGARGSSSAASGHHHHHHLHAAPPTIPRYMVKDLGSIVIGEGGPGLDIDDVDHMAENGGHGHQNNDGCNNSNNEDNNNNNTDSNNNVNNGSNSINNASAGDADKTLADARFVVGDYISCAILPPQADGSVAPASSARMGRGAGAGESRVAVGRAPTGLMGMGIGAGAARENGYGYAHGRHGRGRGGGGGGARGGIGIGAGVPMGEWRRGERLPDIPPSSRGRAGRGRY
ncbi:Sin3 associated polypeptide p18-domain-containing protein [Biscogniauxia mediterranea]|nr:Sin3 associated polypeptide p18-domain-containing protein [Biscogniauxia mediterranea]